MRVLLLLALSLPLLAFAERPKLVVLELTAGGGADPKLARSVTQALTDAVGKTGVFEVVSAAEVEALLGVERQRQLMGCAEGSSCTTELVGALGARFVMAGTLGKLGEAWQLTLTTLDSQKSQPLGRSTRLAADLPTLEAQLPWAVADATATPAPPSPSRVLPFTLLAAGGAAVVAGGLIGLQGLTDEATVRGALSGSQLDLQSRYQQQANAAATLKTAGLITLIAGAGLMAVGIVRLVQTPQGPTVALVPTAGGLALAGSWP